ncbi:MAG: hypothetical protein V4773_29860 [Verrucomicrobiota bacterium]
MKRTITCLILSAFAMALPFTAAAMNNKDVIKLQKAGLSEETILAAMQKEAPEYDTSPDGLVALKTAGVSEKVIQKMMALQASRPTSIVVSQPPPVAAPSVAPAMAVPGTGVFWQEFPSIAPAPVAPVVGQNYFTRYSFHEEKNEHSTTNYARGPVVPINTPVQLVSMFGEKLTLKRLDTGQEIKVENVEKYTKKPISQIAALMLSAEPTPLERLPAEVAAAIRNGEMRRGMTKEVLIMARGYPPAHETASVEGDRWVYWSSRFVKQTVVFTNGRLSEGRGLF